MSTGINIVGQQKLVSGTNIKTVNSTSLLGSGNIALQPILVSGNNIQTINGSNILTSGNLSIGGRAGVEVYQSGLTQNQYQAAAGSGVTLLYGSSYSLTVSTNGNIIKISAMFQGTQSVLATRLRIYAGYNQATLSGSTNIGNFDLSAANVAANADTVLYEKTFRLLTVNGSYSLGGVDPFMLAQGNDLTPQGFNYQGIGDANSIYYPYILLALNQGGILHTVTINYSR